MQKINVGQYSEYKNLLDESDCSKTRHWVKQKLNRIDRRTTRISINSRRNALVGISSVEWLHLEATHKENNYRG